MPEATFLANLSIWSPKVRFESISIPRDVVVWTWFMGGTVGDKSSSVS